MKKHLTCQHNTGIVSSDYARIKYGVPRIRRTWYRRRDDHEKIDTGHGNGNYRDQKSDLLFPPTVTRYIAKFLFRSSELRYNTKSSLKVRIKYDINSYGVD